MQNTPAATNTAVDLYNLSKCKVLSESGGSIELGTLWRDSKAVFVFLRHFACIACRAHAVQVWQHREQYKKANAKLVFIGNGPPDYIADFRNDLGLEKSTIYTDPTRHSFRFAGMRRSVSGLLSVKSAMNAVKLYRAGHRQPQLSAQGDHLQLGGVLVVTPDNKVAYHYVSQALGDFPEQEEIL